MDEDFVALFKAEAYEAALARAEALPPGIWRDRHRGAALLALRRFTEAHAPLKAALDVDPEDFNTLRNFALSAERLAQPEAALRAFHAARAIKHDPRVEAAIGRVMAQTGDATGAEAWLRNAIAAGTVGHRCRQELGQLLLARGDWAAGWPLYEARLDKGDVAVPAAEVRWDGIFRKTDLVILVAEQGAGDLFQFCRFARLIAATGHRVVLRVQTAQRAMMAGLGEDVIVLHHGQGIDMPGLRKVWSPLMSVPGVLGLTPETIPLAGGYLTPPPARAAHDGLLATDKLNIGIAWQGSPKSDADIGRSAPLAALAPLAGLAHVNLISLQRGYGAEQVAECGFAERITVPEDLDPGPDAFTGTAALMARLDLVISTDTGIAHLAGALGRPVMLALQKVPEWRWMHRRRDTPWYRSVRLFRQETRGDWAGVYAEIAGAVAELSPPRRNAAPYTKGHSP